MKELKDFAKLSLKSGETKTATFSLRATDLATWESATHQWQTPSGQFRTYIGVSSADIEGTADITFLESKYQKRYEIEIDNGGSTPGDNSHAGS